MTWTAHNVGEGHKAYTELHHHGTTAGNIGFFRTLQHPSLTLSAIIDVLNISEGDAPTEYIDALRCLHEHMHGEIDTAEALETLRLLLAPRQVTA